MRPFERDRIGQAGHDLSRADQDARQECLRWGGPHRFQKPEMRRHYRRNDPAGRDGECERVKPSGKLGPAPAQGLRLSHAVTVWRFTFAAGLLNLCSAPISDDSSGSAILRAASSTLNHALWRWRFSGQRFACFRTESR